jgi:hypothetical protein
MCIIYKPTEAAMTPNSPFFLNSMNLFPKMGEEILSRAKSLLRTILDKFGFIQFGRKKS